MTVHGKARAAVLASGFVLAALATARAQSTDIPLQLVQSTQGVRLIVNVGIGGQLPRPYLFDTGSDTFNAFYSASAFGTVPLSMRGLPNGVTYAYGDNGVTSNVYVGNLVATPSLTFYPTSSGASSGVTLNATTANGAPSNFLISAVTSHVLEKSSGVVTQRFDISQPVQGVGTFAGYYGIFGAGNFTTQRDGVTVGGVLGQTAIAGTTTGYVVAANGQPLSSLGMGATAVPGASANGPQVEQSVTSCSPCVMLGLTPALLAQFSPIDTLKSASQGKLFSNTNAPSGAEFGINMAVTLALPGHPASTYNQPTLLDTGTGNIEIYNPNINSPGTAPVGGVVTMAAPNTGNVTVDGVYPQGSNSNPNAEPPYEVITSNSKTDTYLGIGFFLQNSVLYNLAGTLVGYTPNFVTDVDIATTSGAPLVIGSGSVPLGLAGIISGPGGLSITSMGSATLSGRNTYTGPTTISGGSLFVVGPGSIAASSGVDVSASGRFDISGIANGASIASLSGDASGIVNLGGQTLTLAAANGNFAGTIAGAGGLTLARGAEILSGVNNYSGPTTINGGVLEVDGSIAASSGVTVNAGGALTGVGIVDPITTLIASGATLAPGNRANPLGR